MNNNLLKLFRNAYRNLELQPLLDQRELDKFRVHYSDDVMAELQQVEDSPSGDSKIIFTGHWGCGKSTLLTEFSKQCDDKYFVDFFSRAVGAPKANMAPADKIAPIFYHLWTRGGSYVAPGVDYYEQLYCERMLNKLQKKAQALGFELISSPVTKVVSLKRGQGLGTTESLILDP